MTNQGYKFIDNGRGSNYQIEITYIPDEQELKVYLCYTLGFHEQSVRNYLNKIKVFLYCILYFDNDFINLDFNQMSKFIYDSFSIKISGQTISKYINNLKWIYQSNDTYLRYSDDNGYRIYISKSYYSNQWHKFNQDIEIINKKQELEKLYDINTDNYKNAFYDLLDTTDAGYTLVKNLHSLVFKKKNLRELQGFYIEQYSIMKTFIPKDTYNYKTNVKSWLIDTERLLEPLSEGPDTKFYE